MTYLKKKILGSLGEWLAKQVYLSQGFTLVGQNITTKISEIDLVFFKSKKLHFVEVKLSTSPNNLCFQTWLSQQSKKLYLSSHIYHSKNYPNCSFQIDFISFDFSQKQNIGVNLISNINPPNHRRKMI